MVDIRTPVMNGKQLYQHMLEEHPELAAMVIFSTGDMINGYTLHFLELAGRPFLAKPFTPTELKNIVNEALRQNE